VVTSSRLAFMLYLYQGFTCFSFKIDNICKIFSMSAHTHYLFTSKISHSPFSLLNHHYGSVVIAHTSIDTEVQSVFLIHIYVCYLVFLVISEHCILEKEAIEACVSGYSTRQASVCCCLSM